MSDSTKQSQPLTDEELAGVVGGGSVNGIGMSGIGGISQIDISSMDIETALLAVQSQRAQLLDGQLHTQIKEVQERNEKVADLNLALNAINTVHSTFASTAGADTKFGSNIDAQQTDKLLSNLTATFKEAGVDLSEPLKDGLTKSEVEGLTTNLKGMIDAEGNTQQMDMLRLQSLSNKRNEAFDVMTNFIKKMQDSRSSIIGNMR